MSATATAPPTTAGSTAEHPPTFPTDPGEADPAPPPFAWPAAPSGPSNDPGPPTGANWVDLRRGPIGAPGASTAPPASSPALSPDHPHEESRRWAMGAHVSAIAGGFLGGVPAFLGPLIVWLLRKDRDGFAASHGRAALNFNLSMLTYAGALLVFTLLTFGLGAVLTAPVGVGLGIVWLTFSIIGAVRAANDQPFRYPITIPFVR